MATVEITDSNFKDSIEGQGDKLVVVDFWAEWCGPCKMLAPILEKLSEKLADKISVFKLDTDQNASSAQSYQITSIPCCILFKNGQEVHRIIGHKTEENFEAELQQFI